MTRPELKEINCPYMRTMLTAPDAPPWDQQSQEMEVQDLVKFVQAQPGDGNMHKVLKFFAIVNHGIDNEPARLAHLAIGSGGRFSTKLIGSRGDHAGDSHIYNPATGDFDRGEFTRFTGFSSDSRTMTVDNLGAAIVDANQRHNGSSENALQSAGEFALLSILLGDGSGTIQISDMERLFVANEFPEGARENLGKRTAAEWSEFSVKIAESISKAAVRIRHHEGEMGVEQVKNRLKTLFALLQGG